MKAKRKVGVLISGNGSNLQALIDAAQAEDFPAQIVHVISNKPEAFGLRRAADAGISATVLSHKDYESREAFDRAIQDVLTSAGVEIVCLAGFMRLLSPWLVQQWEGRMLNIHPSLLPSFKGGNAVGDALAYGVKITGCTVHLVTPEVDSGPILTQGAVPVLQDDTEETLRARINTLEHEIYPATLKWLAENA